MRTQASAVCVNVRGMQCCLGAGCCGEGVVCPQWTLISRPSVCFHCVSLSKRSQLVSTQVIGTFEDSFTELREKLRQKRLLFSRTGFVSAFVLLDLNLSEVRDCSC